MPNQNNGEGRGCLRPGDLRGGMDHPPDQTGGKSASSSLGGIDAPGAGRGCAGPKQLTGLTEKATGNQVAYMGQIGPKSQRDKLNLGPHTDLM